MAENERQAQGEDCFERSFFDVCSDLACQTSGTRTERLEESTALPSYAACSGLEVFALELMEYYRDSKCNGKSSTFPKSSESSTDPESGLAKPEQSYKRLQLNQNGKIEEFETEEHSYRYIGTAEDGRDQYLVSSQHDQEGELLNGSLSMKNGKVSFRDFDTGITREYARKESADKPGGIYESARQLTVSATRALVGDTAASSVDEAFRNPGKIRQWYKQAVDAAQKADMQGIAAAEPKGSQPDGKDQTAAELKSAPASMEVSALNKASGTQEASSQLEQKLAPQTQNTQSFTVPNLQEADRVVLSLPALNQEKSVNPGLVSELTSDASFTASSHPIGSDTVALKSTQGQAALSTQNAITNQETGRTFEAIGKKSVPNPEEGVPAEKTSPGIYLKDNFKSDSAHEREVPGLSGNKSSISQDYARPSSPVHFATNSETVLRLSPIKISEAKAARESLPTSSVLARKETSTPGLVSDKQVQPFLFGKSEIRTVAGSIESLKAIMNTDASRHSITRSNAQTNKAQERALISSQTGRAESNLGQTRVLDSHTRPQTHELRFPNQLQSNSLTIVRHLTTDGTQNLPGAGSEPKASFGLRPDSRTARDLNSQNRQQFGIESSNITTSIPRSQALRGSDTRNNPATIRRSPEGRYMIAELSLAFVLAAGGIRRITAVTSKRSESPEKPANSISTKLSQVERGFGKSQTQAEVIGLKQATESKFRPGNNEQNQRILSLLASNRLDARNAKLHKEQKQSQPAKQALFKENNLQARLQVNASGTAILQQSPERSLLETFPKEETLENLVHAVREFLDFGDPFTDFETEQTSKRIRYKGAKETGSSGCSSGDKGDDSDEDEENEINRTTNLIFKRPQCLIAEGQTLVSIAEEYFSDPYLAWLIADLNTGSSKEHWMDGKRIVEFQVRQQVTLPVWQDIVEFYGSMPSGACPENLITIVCATQIDREAVDSVLGPIVSGEKRDCIESSLQALDSYGSRQVQVNT